MGLLDSVKNSLSGKNSQGSGGGDFVDKAENFIGRNKINQVKKKVGERNFNKAEEAVRKKFGTTSSHNQTTNPQGAGNIGGTNTSSNNTSGEYNNTHSSAGNLDTHEQSYGRSGLRDEGDSRVPATGSSYGGDRVSRDSVQSGVHDSSSNHYDNNRESFGRSLNRDSNRESLNTSSYNERDNRESSFNTSSNTRGDGNFTSLQDSSRVERDQRSYGSGPNDDDNRRLGSSSLVEDVGDSNATQGHGQYGSSHNRNISIGSATSGHGNEDSTFRRPGDGESAYTSDKFGSRTDSDEYQSKPRTHASHEGTHSNRVDGTIPGSQGYNVDNRRGDHSVY